MKSAVKFQYIRDPLPLEKWFTPANCGEPPIFDSVNITLYQTISVGSWFCGYCLIKWTPPLLVPCLKSNWTTHIMADILPLYPFETIIPSLDFHWKPIIYSLSITIDHYQRLVTLFSHENSQFGSHWNVFFPISPWPAPEWLRSGRSCCLPWPELVKAMGVAAMAKLPAPCDIHSLWTGKLPFSSLI